MIDGNIFYPCNDSFACDKNSAIYVDKTELINYLNSVLGTNSKYIAVSHARYSERILLVGINYDLSGKDKKHHTCVIEEC